MVTVWIQKWKVLKHRKYVSIVILSLILIVVAVVSYLVLVPCVSTIVITKLVELRNGSRILSQWQHQPVPLLTRIYLWNLTNAEDVSAGLSSPVLSQVGPYVYEQFTEKIPIMFKENSIVYYSRTRYRWREDLTAPLTLDDTVVTLHAGLYGAAVFVESISTSMVSLINDAVPYLFPGVESIFVSVRVGSYLFDGLVLNCSSVKGTTAEMVCKTLPHYAPPTIRQKENSSDFIYSFLGHKNMTLQGPYEENRGLRDIRNLGTLMSLHNRSQLQVWQKGSYCDQLLGTDTLIFPPFLNNIHKIHFYISDICQVVTVDFEKEDYFHGLPVYKYSLPNNWLASVLRNPDNSCYCVGNKKQFCHKNGLRDISKCTKAPVVMSLPHFYLADEEFQNYAQGMHPDRDLHTSVLYIEPQTGAPVKGAKRIQFNMFLKKIEGFNLVQNVSEGLFPLLWIEEAVELSDEELAQVKVPLSIQKAVKIGCLLVAVLSLLVACSAMLGFLCLSRIWCFCHISNNQVTMMGASNSPHQGSLAQSSF